MDGGGWGRGGLFCDIVIVTDKVGDGGGRGLLGSSTRRRGKGGFMELRWGGGGGGGRGR